MELEFTTTACNRPEILEKTYKSFTTNLKDINFNKSTLYINIDPSPDNNNITKNIEIAKKYFGKVIYNLPKESNFAEAILWCFNQVKGEFFFHLEDDWILLREINIDNMIKLIKNEKLQCILNKKNIHELYEPSFIPSLFYTKIIKIYINLMDNKSNPECQMKEIFRSNLYDIQKYKSIPYLPGYELSRDIGRNWLLQNGLERDYDKNRKDYHKEWTPWTTWKNII